MQVIVTRCLTLEPQVAAHADEMFGVLSDPAIYEHENAPPPSVEWLRERFGTLESRVSADGREQWLNWVVRLRTSEPIGYVQATVFPTGRAAIAYEMASRYWGRGFAREACEAMLSELAARYGVRQAHAVFKRSNIRSLRLLERLGFAPALPEAYVGSDELLMTRSLSTGAEA
jgi:ribosomal-protein-alanine N-acetyltransferase